MLRIALPEMSGGEAATDRNARWSGGVAVQDLG
jgi:hypothetical protein